MELKKNKHRADVLMAAFSQDEGLTDRIAALEAENRELRKMLSRNADDASSSMNRAKEYSDNLTTRIQLVENRYQSIVEDQTEMVIRLNTEGRLTFVNESFCMYSGRKSADLPGSTLQSLMEKDDYTVFMKSIDSLTPESPTVIIEQKMKDHEGRTSWLQWINRAVLLRGSIVEYQCVGRDISPLMDLMDDLNEKHNLIKGLVNSTSESILIIDREYVVRLINDHGAGLLGISTGDTREMLHRQLPGLFTDTMDRCINEKEETEFTFDLKGRIYECSMFPIYNEQNKLEYAGAFIRDITRVRKLERELIEISEKERQRIGQNLHDGLGQQLTGITYLTHSILKKLTRESHDLAVKTSELYHHEKKAMEILRRITRDMVPVTVEKNGFADALRQLLEDTQEVFNVDCELRYHEDLYMDSFIATNLYYIVREAINNAVKHGAPENITVIFELKGNRFNLTIANDITTRNNDSIIDESVSGVGIDIMRYRAEMIQADLQVFNDGREFKVSVNQY